MKPTITRVLMLAGVLGCILVPSASAQELNDCSVSYCSDKPSSHACYCPDPRPLPQPVAATCGDWHLVCPYCIDSMSTFEEAPDEARGSTAEEVAPSTTSPLAAPVALGAEEPARSLAVEASESVGR